MQFLWVALSMRTTLELVIFSTFPTLDRLSELSLYWFRLLISTLKLLSLWFILGPILVMRRLKSFLFLLVILLARLLLLQVMLFRSILTLLIMPPSSIGSCPAFSSRVTSEQGARQGFGQLIRPSTISLPFGS